MPAILRSSPASPFGRKVKIVLAELGFEDRFIVDIADTMSDADSLRQQNPLGKIPAIVLEDGRSIYDSRVIVEYLDLMAGGGKVIPTDPEARVNDLTLQALADGIMDASILLRYEILFRPEDKREAKWVEHQNGKIQRSLAHLEAHVPSPEAAVSIGTIALCCALAYRDFRFSPDWRKSAPQLGAWFEGYAPKLKGWDKTKPD